jgi:hypothetical protein
MKQEPPLLDLVTQFGCDYKPRTTLHQFIKDLRECPNIILTDLMQLLSPIPTILATIQEITKKPTGIKKPKKTQAKEKRDLEICQLNVIVTLKNTFLSNSVLVNKIIQKMNHNTIKAFVIHCVALLGCSHKYTSFSIDKHLYELLIAFYGRYTHCCSESTKIIYEAELRSLYGSQKEILINTKYLGKPWQSQYEFLDF